MLVLTRKRFEGAWMRLPDGRLMRVSVSLIDGNAVRIAIDAPPDVVVLRDEAAERAGWITNKTA